MFKHRINLSFMCIDDKNVLNSSFLVKSFCLFYNEIESIRVFYTSIHHLLFKYSTILSIYDKHSENSSKKYAHFVYFL